MIEKYLHLDYSSFDTDYSIKDQQLMTEESLNKSPRKLKKEQNDTYNLLQIMNGFLAIAWVDVEFYDQGEIVSFNNKNYIALKQNQRKQPDTQTEYWQLITAKDISSFNKDNYLAKDNQDPYYTERKQAYEKTTDFHPATKLYVDQSIEYTVKNVKVANADRLDGHDSLYFLSKDEYNDAYNKSIVDDLVTDDNKKVLSAKQGKILKDLVDHINAIITSNDINLDTLQEIVDFIKKNKDKLDKLGINNIIGLKAALDDKVPLLYWNNKFLDRIKEVDGTGSGVDADLLDGLDSSAFWTKNELNNVKIRELLGQTQGAGSGIDADKLDGLDSTSFLRRDVSDTPTADNSYDLGSNNLRWRTIYADTFYGTALRAKYADLAEKYKTDNEYEPGTILGLNATGLGTIYNQHMKYLGVVSTAPALKLNSEAEGCYIALKGLVPVKIEGYAKPGQYILAYRDGCGIAVNDYNFEESKRLIGLVIEGGFESCQVKI